MSSAAHPKWLVGVTVHGMSDPLFRLVCPPSAFDQAPAGWATDMLSDGEVALQLGDGDAAAIDAAAHALGYLTVPVLRREETPEQLDETVIAYAGSLPLIWIAPQFSEPVSRWARERGPMTLLAEAEGPLPQAELDRLTRFVALLGRQID